MRKKIHAFTIVSKSHIKKGIASLMSICGCNRNIIPLLFVVDGVSFKFENITVISIQDLSKDITDIQELTIKYGSLSDEFRWSLKPVLALHILKMHRDSIVLYSDCDTFYFRDPKCLFTPLKNGGIVLTPHWRPLNPNLDEKNFRLNFLDGLFNAGCFSANLKGADALQWWISACKFACLADRNLGLWHDQRYLDLMLIYFPETRICRNKMCNMADWNRHIRNSLNLKERNSFSPIMVHFTKNTIKRIQEQCDVLLSPYYEDYCKYIKEIETMLTLENEKNYSLFN